MLLKQQKMNAGDVLDFSSLTLEEPSSPEEEVVTNTSSSSSSKVSPTTRLEKNKKIAEYVFPGIKRCNVVKVLFYLRVLPQLLLLSGILSVFVFVLCSPCCSTPLHSMTRWRRSLMFLTTPLLSCQTTLKGFWSRCWRNLQRRWWMSPRSPSLMRRAQPASQSQAAPPPVWCMDPTTTSTKVGQSFCVTAAHQSAEVDFQLTETLKDVL